MTVARAAFALGLAALACALCACGDEESTEHGLTHKPLESTPTGDAVTVSFAVEDDATWTGTISMRTRIWQRQRTDGRPDDRRGQGTAEIEVVQRFEQPTQDRAPKSYVQMRYVKAVGRGAAAYLARPPITGTLDHEPNGRPKARSLRVDGGTKEAQREALDLLGGLMFAGFGGSPTWIPPRPIRVGEAWQLESFVHLRAVDSILLQARRLGVQVPQPTFSGTARLEKVTEGPDGPLLEISIDALIEMQGAFSKDGGTGHMSVGDQVRGRAVIAQRTGLPVSFEVTHTGKKQYRTGGAYTEQEFTSEIEGRVSRTRR